MSAREAEGSTGDEDAPPESASLIELVLATHVEAPAAAPAPQRIDGVMIGRLVGHDASGTPLVMFAGLPAEGAPARSMVALAAADMGREVALMFEEGNPDRPLVMGLVHVPAPGPVPVPARAPEGLSIEADGERLVLSAEKEIVLRCGEASITLTRAGKVLIRGAYVLTRASGVNRIQGGAVQIN